MRMMKMTISFMTISFQYKSQDKGNHYNVPRSKASLAKPSTMLLIKLLDMHKRKRRKEKPEERHCGIQIAIF